MSEEKLQSDIAVRFSQLYPGKRGQLFHVSNERNNKIQAYRARAIGIVPGVADFVYFDRNRKVATELKVPGSRHDRQQIEVQVLWGEVWESQGGMWRLCRTVDEAINCYKGLKSFGLTILDVKRMLKQQMTKTIKF